MRILVTRPEPDATHQAAELSAAGHDVLKSPLLNVIFDPPDHFVLDDVGGLIATSRNALRAIQNHVDLEELTKHPVYAVGKNTARLAQDLGFQVIVTGQDNAAALAADIVNAHPAPDQSKVMLYLAPQKAAYPLEETLSNNGYKVRKSVVYQTVAAGDLSSDARDALDRNALDLVILMSQRTAKTWVELGKALGLSEKTAKIRHICLSDAVARALHPFNPDMIEIASHPKNEEILALIHHLAAKSDQGC